MDAVDASSSLQCYYQVDAIWDAAAPLYTSDCSTSDVPRQRTAVHRTPILADRPDYRITLSTHETAVARKLFTSPETMWMVYISYLNGPADLTGTQ